MLVLTGTLFIFHSNVADGSDPFDVQFACNSSPDWYCSLVPVITGSCRGNTVGKYENNCSSFKTRGNSIIVKLILFIEVHNAAKEKNEWKSLNEKR